MGLKNNFVKLFTFKGEDEYDGAKKIYLEELKVYRKQWQFILGVVLFAVPLLTLLVIVDAWYYKLMILCIALGEMCIRDTIAEHFCLKLYRKKVSEEQRNHGNYIKK